MCCAIVLVAAGCGGSSPETTPDVEGQEMLPSISEPGLRFSVSDSAPRMVVLTFRDDYLDELLEDEPQRDALLVDAFRPPVDITRIGHVFGGGRGASLDEVLPDNQTRNRDVDCTNRSFGAVDQRGDLLVVIAPGFCGMEYSQPAVEFGAVGVEIGDERFIDDPPGPAEAGTVAIDRRASRGFAPGAPVGVVLVPVPEEDIAPPPYGREWEPLREYVCFDVTVHAGAAGPEGRVVPDVVVSEAGERVVIAEPSGAAIYNFPPRVIVQDAGSAVVWSFGPVDLDEHRPDEITVTAAEGEIVSWDVSARHC
jgi:hypothetical protein